MLQKLVNSGNVIVAKRAQSILSGRTSVDEELKYCGSFLRAVLEGDYQTALNRADHMNYLALTGSSKSSQVVPDPKEELPDLRKIARELVKNKWFDLAAQCILINKEIARRQSKKLLDGIEDTINEQDHE